MSKSELFLISLFMENVIVFILGLVVGSFINAQVYRVAIRYKILDIRFKIKDKNRSFCDFCGKQLRWWENIPVISYLVQGGKSSCCGKKLSVLYPITELTMGILFLIFYQKFGQVVNLFLLFLGMAIIGFLVFSTVFDLKYMILPDFSTYSLIFLALVYRIVVGDSIDLIMAGAWWGLSAYCFFYFLHVLTKGKGMGFGDVKLAFFIGLFLGWPRIVVSLYIAFIIGALVGVGLIIFSKKKRKNRLIPFGPFMILGVIVAWFWGIDIWNYFLKALY
jgi:leader peptidase (prepilin peptidase)/N-methyltransferase